MTRKIAVLGCGAIGSSISADLIEAGLDVTVIDQWPAQVEALVKRNFREVGDAQFYVMPGRSWLLSVTWNP